MWSKSSFFDRALFLLIAFLLAWMFQIHMRLTHVDYNTFHRAGLSFLQGNWSSLYSPERSSMGGFLYPLGAASFFALFSWIGEFHGRVGFYLILAFALWGSMLWCVKRWPKTRQPLRPIWITLLLASRSINDSWISGNLSLLLLGLALVALAQDGIELHDPARSPTIRPAIRKHLSAGALALAISFKIFPALLGAFWIWKRDWRQVLRITAWTLVFYFAPYVCLGIFQGSFALAGDLFQKWLFALKDPANFGSAEMIHFQNLSAALHGWSSRLGVSSRIVPVILALLTALLAFLPTLRRSSSGSSSETLSAASESTSALATKAAILLAWVPLLTPVTWHHLGVFYLPLLYATACQALDPHATPSEQRQASVSLWAFFLFYTLTGRNVWGVERHAWISLHRIPLIGILALVLPSTLKLLRKSPPCL